MSHHVNPDNTESQVSITKSYCPRCEGTGKIVKGGLVKMIARCPACNGDGVV